MTATNPSLPPVRRWFALGAASVFDLSGRLLANDRRDMRAYLESCGDLDAFRAASDRRFVAIAVGMTTMALATALGLLGAIAALNAGVVWAPVGVIVFPLAGVACARYATRRRPGSPPASRR